MFDKPMSFANLLLLSEMAHSVYTVKQIKKLGEGSESKLFTMHDSLRHRMVEGVLTNNFLVGEINDLIELYKSEFTKEPKSACKTSRKFYRAPAFISKM